MSTQGTQDVRAASSKGLARLLKEAALEPDSEPSPGDPSPPPTFPRLPELPGFDVVREIGRGGQGIVYEAIQRSTPCSLPPPGPPLAR